MNNWKQRSLVIIFNFNIKVDTGMRSSAVSYYQYLGYWHAVLVCILSTQTPHEIVFSNHLLSVQAVRKITIILSMVMAD